MSHVPRTIERMFDRTHQQAPASLDFVTARAADVAAILREELGGSGDVKIHKLLYYVQGHHLAWHGRPAFAETIEAWINGPVVADLWISEKYDPPPEPAGVDGDVLEVVCMVASRYGHLTGKDLIKLSHNEDPWRDLSESDEATTGANTPISHDALRAFFSHDDDLTPMVRDQVDSVQADGDWIPTKPGELDELEAEYLTT